MMGVLLPGELYQDIQVGSLKAASVGPVVGKLKTKVFDMMVWAWVRGAEHASANAAAASPDASCLCIFIGLCLDATIRFGRAIRYVCQGAYLDWRYLAPFPGLCHQINGFSLNYAFGIGLG
jgi:hypothetical protein